MQSAATFDIAPWMRTPELVRVLGVLNAAKGDGKKAAQNALIVGGAVRNLILKKPVHDVDIACIFAPEKTVSILSAAGIKTVPTGIDHGTVTAVVDGRSFEVTTLRHDVETDGRHAKVNFTSNWAEDARRRDFTMNTLLMDLNGRVYDPLGNGLADAKAGLVRFVGEPARRIKEDYLRILRFFRFWAIYGAEDRPDPEALMACAALREGMEQLSRERISAEIMKIVMAPRGADALRLMLDHGILEGYIAEDFDPEVLKRLARLQDRFGAQDPMSRLIVAASQEFPVVQTLIHRLVLSRDQKKTIHKFYDLLRHDFSVSAAALKRAMYFYGRDIVLQAALIHVSARPIGAGAEFKIAAMVRFIAQWDIPTFPISGGDLKDNGYVEGPKIGEALLELQQRWLDSDFSLSKDSLIKWLKAQG